MLKRCTKTFELKYNQLGMALPLVLIFSAALLAFGAALLNYSLNDKVISDYYSQDVTKYYLAESGLEAGFTILQSDFYYQGIICGSLGEGIFTVNFIDTAPEKRLIVAEGKLDSYSLTLKMLVEKDPVKGPVIIKWLGE